MNRMDKSLRTRAIQLPRADRSLETFQLSEPKHFPDRQSAKLNRVAFAAAHVTEKVERLYGLRGLRATARRHAPQSGHGWRQGLAHPIGEH